MPGPATVQASAARVTAALRQYGDRIVSYALPTALTRTAQDARAALRRALPTTFDRPTPYTLNSTYVRPATRADRRAWVGFRDFAGKGTPAARYLLPNVEGGARRLKGSEVQLRGAGLLPPGLFAVPGEEAELDAYGNMKRGQLVKILSAVRAFGEQGYTANRRGVGRGKRRTEAYFAAPPGNRQGLPPGIYRRDGADPRPVILFVKPPSYRPRFRFYAIVESAVRDSFPTRFAEALTDVQRRFAASSGGRS
jgi:hypothetical protein